MILVLVGLRAASSHEIVVLVGLIPWLGLLVFLHLAARGRLSGITHPPDTAPNHFPERIPGRQRTEKVLSDKLVLERTLGAMLEDFIQSESDNFQIEMDRILARIGSYAGANRCYLYRSLVKEGGAERISTWLTPADDTVSGPPARLSRAEVERAAGIFGQETMLLESSFGSVDSSRLVELPWLPMRETIGCFGAVKILRGKTLVGFLGFDSPAQTSGGQGEKKILRLAANLFSSHFSRVEVQELQNEAMKALEESNRAQNDFLANMSHEIRTPLNGIIGIPDILMEMNLTPAQNEYVEIIRKSGNLLLHLVDNILDIAKLGANRVEIDPVETDIQNLIESLAVLTAFNCSAKGLDLIFRVAPGLPARVMVDSSRLNQVLSNLLNNAVKFTKAGHIYLEVAPGATDGESIELVFTVRDTGIGFTAEQSAGIFDKFAQADSGTTRIYGGSGLGLALCREMVDLLGGTIQGCGTPDWGATFSFSIRARRLVTPLTLPPQNPRTVLLLSGQPLEGAVLAERIIRMGHRCIADDNIDRALQLFESQCDGRVPAWDLVIIDSERLPDGLDEILSAVQKGPPDRRPEIAVLSRLGEQGSRSEPAKWGVQAVVTKPVRKSQLEALLGRAPFAETTEQATTESDLGTLPFHDSPAELAGVRVLVAEDNLFNQKVIGAVLKSLGCDVSLASHGKEALAMVKCDDHDIVLMDCQMPEMDGYEATRNIRKLSGPVSGIPIVALTANAFSEDRHRCLEAGMTDFLTKPATKQQVASMLAKYQPTTVTPANMNNDQSSLVVR